MTSTAVSESNAGDSGVAPDLSCRVEESLGRFSSHPRWSGLQLRVWYAIATAPLLAAAILFSRFVASSPDAAVTMLVDYARPLLLYGATAAGFAVGMSLTAAITIQARRCRRVVDDAGAPPWLFIAAVSSMVAIAFVMLVLSFTLDLPPRGRSLVTCLGILPLVMIQSLLKVSLRNEGPDGRPRPGQFRPWTVILPALPVAFVLATQVEGVSRWLASFDFINKVIGMVGSGVPGVDAEVLRRWVVTAIVGIVVSPLLMAATSAMMRFWTSDDTSAGDESDAPSANSLFPLLGERHPSAASGDSRNSLDQEELREQFLEHPLLVALLGGNPLFNDRVRRIFTQITESARQSRSENPDAPAWERPSADVLVEGDAASGRTTAVIAAVLHGALCEGDHALFLVPQESAVEPLAESVRTAIAAAGVDTFLDVETLAPSTVAEWLGPTVARPSPVVIVGTPSQFERAFFEGTSMPERRRAALSKIGVVVVEDLDRYGFDDLVHLPFLLHKIRLFLATTGDSCRVVVNSLPLTRAGRAIVRARLFDSRRMVGLEAIGLADVGNDAAAFETAARVVPLSSRASIPLFVQHLASVARLLPGRHPIHRSWWIACGLPEDRHLRTAAFPELPIDSEILSDREALLDPPVSPVGRPDRLRATDASGTSWPWVTLDGDVANPRPLPVGIGNPIDPGAGFLLDDDGIRITPVFSIPRRNARIAEIKEQAMVLGRIDLAYMTRLTWQSLGVDYGFRRISQHGDTTTIEAVPAGGAALPSDRAILGVPTIEWPDSPQAEDLGLASGPCRGRTAMFALHADARPMSTRWEFTGRYDDRGSVVNVSPPIGYTAESTVFAILFDQPIARQTVEQVSEDLGGAWRRITITGGSHVPELGAAVSAAIARVAPGLERYARCIGLRLNEVNGVPQRYAVMVVEPATTGGTARECVLEMLMDAGSITGLFREIEAVLAAGGLAPYVNSDYAIAPVVNGPSLEVDNATTTALRSLFGDIVAGL